MGASGVELRGAAEIARRLGVIEAVEQIQAQVEIDLRLGVPRRNREFVVAEPGIQLLGRVGLGGVSVLRRDGHRAGQRQKKGEDESHHSLRGIEFGRDLTPEARPLPTLPQIRG
jgi:hypothetical protein